MFAWDIWLGQGFSNLNLCQWSLYKSTNFVDSFMTKHNQTKHFTALIQIKRDVMVVSRTQDVVHSKPHKDIKTSVSYAFAHFGCKMIRFISRIDKELILGVREIFWGNFLQMRLTLLQSATALFITKCDSCFIIKCDWQSAKNFTQSCMGAIGLALPIQ